LSPAKKISNWMLLLIVAAVLVSSLTLITCGSRVPILINDAEYFCNWNQGGGNPARTAFVNTAITGFPNPIWRRPQQSALLVEPTAGLGYLFIPTTNSRIEIVSYEDGREFGELKFHGPVPAPCGLVDSLIVVNEDGRRMVVDNWVLGKRVWQVELHGTDFEPLIFNKRVYWQDGTAMFHCYDVTEGRRIWEKKLEYNLISPAAASDSGVVLAGNGPVIECLSPTDGHSLWHVQMKDRIRNPLEIVGDTLLYCTTTGHIGTLSMKDGHQIWDVVIVPDLLTPPATDGEGIYVGTNNGRFMRLSFNSGQLTWEKEIGSPIKAGATIFGDMVIFVGLNHKVYFVDKKDGTVRSEFETKGMLTARPIACFNRIFIAGEDKNLYCFQVAGE
jgi:outer membrane protein assembly factor BamB